MKDSKGFRTLFNQAGEYCNQCYLFSEANEEESRRNAQALANNSLVEIITLCVDNEIQEIAKGAVRICRGCDYRDPNIFKHLESNGFTFR